MTHIKSKLHTNTTHNDTYTLILVSSIMRWVIEIEIEELAMMSDKFSSSDSELSIGRLVVDCWKSFIAHHCQFNFNGPPQTKIFDSP